MDNQIPVRLTLVSASPRRRELLETLGVPFDVFPADAEEVMNGSDGSAVAVFNARRKVERSSWAEDRSRLLLGADTLIELDGTLFGKPDNLESARRMLTTLSGREHQVITGVCLSGPAATPNAPFIRAETAACTRVRFRELTSHDIQAYLDTREWQGKAGAYAVQGVGRNLVASLDGDLDNVVGLPVTLIHDLIGTHFSHCRFL